MSTDARTALAGALVTVIGPGHWWVRLDTDEVQDAAAILVAMPDWRFVPADELDEMQRRIDRWEERALGLTAAAVLVDAERLAAARDELVGRITFLLDGEFGPTGRASVRYIDETFAALAPAPSEP